MNSDERSACEIPLTANEEQAPREAPGAGSPTALPVKPENVFHFPDGVPAFETAKRFVFLARPDTRPFFFMQALEPRELNFVCVDPFLVCPEFRLNLSPADEHFLGLERPEDAFVAAIVTVTPSPHDITANLQGPIVVNLRTSIGKQVVAADRSDMLRYRLWNAIGARQAGEPERSDPRRPI